MAPTRRRMALLLLLAALVAVLVPLAAAAGLNVVVSDVTVSPNPPAPGEPVTFEATIDNADDSGASFEVTGISLRAATSDRFEEPTEYAHAEGPGTIPPGRSLTLPLTTTFETPGQRRLRVVVEGETPRGLTRTYEYPVTVEVAERHPAINLEVNRTVAGSTGTGEVTVSNGLSEMVSNLSLRVRSRGMETWRNRSIRARLPAGESVSSDFLFEATDPGPHDLEAELAYTVGDDIRRTTTATRQVRVDDVAETVSVRLRPGENGTAVVAEVVNSADVPITDVSLAGEAETIALYGAHIERIPAAAARRADLQTSGDPAGENVTVTATYDIGPNEGRETSQRRFDEVASTDSVVGNISLTGVSVRPEAGKLHISGSASNVGLTTVNSSVVRVLETERVKPAYPNQEYFVGQVPASDFATFDVYARTRGNVSAIPLKISFLSDGEQRTRTVRVDVPAGGASVRPGAGAGAQAGAAAGQGGAPPGAGGGGPPNQGGGGGGLPLLPIGAVVLVLGGGVLFYRRRRNRARR
jgi:hypothetical protein